MLVSKRKRTKKNLENYVKTKCLRTKLANSLVLWLTWALCPRYTVFCHPVAWSVKLLIIMKPFQYGETFA